jgi:alpha-1,4-digalacturonate transport system substrate-binding protein
MKCDELDALLRHQAQVWINHPDEVIERGHGRPSFWGGSASVPRVQPDCGLAVVTFDGVAPQPDLTYAWFPRAAFDETGGSVATAFARSGQGLVGLLGDRSLERVEAGPSAGCETRLPVGADAGSCGWARPASTAASRPSPSASVGSRRSRRWTGASSLTIRTMVWSSSVRTEAWRPRPPARSGGLDDGDAAGDRPGRRAGLNNDGPAPPVLAKGRNSMRRIGTLAAVLALTAPATAAFAGDVRVMWYSDGVEGAVIEDLLARFMQENPGINVILDNVAYQVVQEQLPIQLEAGQGPDIARVTNLKALADHWLDLTPLLEHPDYWRENFGDRTDWMRPDGSDAITGFMTQLTLTGGFANATLFEQAGIAVPGPTATWDEWAEASGQVAEALALPAGFAIDRSGHRISGPAVSYGANYVGPDGMPAPVDEGTKAFVEQLVQWTEDGTHLKEVWVSAAGSTYRAAAEDFINAQIPFYYSGSWQVANLSTKIGDAFDWVATGSPCGTEACSGLAGGAGLVAIKYTQNPEEVAQVMEYLARQDIVKEFSERTLFLPAHKGVVEAGGLVFVSDDPQVQPALERFVEAAGETAPAADALPPWKWASAYFGALVTRTSQVMAGELSLEDAYARMDQDIADQVAQAQQ